VAAAPRNNPFITLSLPPTRPKTPQRILPANPFFDNIRQNIELSHGGITERIPLGLPSDVAARADELPDFLRDLAKMPDDESMTLLAEQFQALEKSEQNRLQSIMDVLSKEGSSISHHPNAPHNADDVERLMKEGSDFYFPFSITAGVERGTRNRYKNIWPYDFSRVRLGALADDDSDYINASFVQPRGTTRRYIATQGPLDATCRDFWTVVWEQNVHVIVMWVEPNCCSGTMTDVNRLTKQFEGGLKKCGQYWMEQQFGDLRLQVVSETGGVDRTEGVSTGFDFGAPRSAPGSENSKPEDNIKRMFLLWNVNSPNDVRKVAHVQCVSWPDFDVPESPEVLIQIIRDVDEAMEEIAGCSDDRCSVPPVLVHCSAGIGRTGSYILADAVIDGLRREHRLRASGALTGL
jgi:protein tyrosine phosphatase